MRRVPMAKPLITSRRLYLFSDGRPVALRAVACGEPIPGISANRRLIPLDRWRAAVRVEDLLLDEQ